MPARVANPTSVRHSKGGRIITVWTACTMNNRLDYIVYFRATSIVLIVAGHSFGLVWVQFNNILDYELANLIKGATSLFVFVSGFMFDYIYNKDFSYRKFLYNRISRILFPYIVMTVVAQFIFWGWPLDQSMIEQFSRNLFLGDTFQAYWYVPFILTTFLLSPIHKWYLDQNLPTQLWMLAALTLAAGVVHRPLDNDNVLQSVVFFTPIYLMGMLMSSHRETLLPLLQKYSVPLVFAAIAMVTIQSLRGQTDNMQKAFFSINGFELMVIQKMLVSIALLSCFSRLSGKPNFIVELVSETSFAIFFIHPFVIMFMGDTDVFRITGAPWLDFVAAVSVIVFICVATALVWRLLLKKYSRYVVGY